MQRAIKRNIKKNTTKDNLNKKTSVAKKVVATTLILGTLAGATTVVLTNDKVKTTLGIGSEQLESENNDDSKTTELQSQIDLLKSEKSALQTELAEYKANLDTEKELTAEQQLHIQELESAIAEKDNQISTFENLVEELQSELNDYKTNSVEETLNIATLINGSSLTDALVDGDDLILCHSNGIEWQSISTRESKVLSSNMSSYAGSCYKDSVGTIWLNTKNITFGYFDKQTKEVVSLNTSFYNNLSESEVFETESYIAFVDSSKIVFVNKETKELIKEVSYSSTYGYLKIENNIYICNTNFVKYDLNTVTETVLSDSVSNCKLFEVNGRIYLSSFNSTTPGLYVLEDNQSLTTLSDGLYNMTIIGNEEVVIAYSSSDTYILNSDTNLFDIQDSTITSSNYRNYQIVNGHIFDKYFNYVFNKSTNAFQLCRSSASTKYSAYLIHQNYLITTLDAKYFNEDTLMFESFTQGEGAIRCENLIKVNDYLFGGYYTSTTGSVSTTFYGLHYIDFTDMTYKKVPVKSGLSSLTNTGFNFDDIRMVNERYLMAKTSDSRASYSMIIVDMENFEIVFSATYANKVFVYNDTVIFVDNTGTASRFVLDEFIVTTATIGSLSSKEYFIYGDKICVTTKYAGKYIFINPVTLETETVYGLGGIEFGQFRLGLAYNTNYSSSLFDTTTGDSLDIEPITKETQIKSKEDVLYLLGTKTVYWL